MLILSSFGIKIHNVGIQQQMKLPESSLTFGSWPLTKSQKPKDAFIKSSSQVVSFKENSKSSVTAFKTSLENTSKYQDNIRLLTETDWKEGDLLIAYQKNTPDKPKLEMFHPQLGKIGKIPDPVSEKLIPLINKGHKLTFELSDIKGGTADDIPLEVEVNVKYALKDENIITFIPKIVMKTFKSIIKIADLGLQVFPYHPEIPPEKLLDTLASEPEVDNIVKEIKNAKSILLLGHKSPDGDTTGSLLGFHAALESIGKNVDCCIDDDFDGLLRNKLPGIDKYIKKAGDLDPNRKYDLVIIIDTPVPERMGATATFIKSAKQVAFIDHHPMIREKWLGSVLDTGVSIGKIKKSGLMWVKDDMPAASEMIAAIIFKLVSPEIAEKMSVEQKQEIAIPLVAGMMTDTKLFTERTETDVESVAKGLMNWADFGRKWLRDNLRYHLPTPARNKMLEYAKEGTIIDNHIGYASIQIPYEKFMDVFKTAKLYDSSVTLLDVENEFKFSDLFLKTLRKNPNTHKNDRVVVLMIQKAIKEVEGKDEIIMSFRSGSNTNFAQKVANIFGGGGHGTAAAAVISGHKLTDLAYKDIKDPFKTLTLERSIAQATEIAIETTNSLLSKALNLIIKLKRAVAN